MAASSNESGCICLAEDKKLILNLITEYLLRYCYDETANTLMPTTFTDSHDATSNCACVLKHVTHLQKSLAARKATIQSLNAGNVEKTLELLQQNFASIEHTEDLLYFKVQCQQFIELVRRKQLVEALEYAQNVLAQACKVSPACTQYLQVMKINFDFRNCEFAFF